MYRSTFAKCPVFSLQEDHVAKEQTEFIQLVYIFTYLLSMHRKQSSMKGIKGPKENSSIGCCCHKIKSARCAVDNLNDHHQQPLNSIQSPMSLLKIYS